MKKLLCILFSLLFVFSLAACGESDNEGEFRILMLAEKDLYPELKFEVEDQDGKIWLENDDVEKVCVTYEKEKGRYLELRLTKSGAKSLKKALKNEETVLSIMVNDKKLASPLIQDDIEDNSAIVTGEYETIMDYFNALT